MLLRELSAEEIILIVAHSTHCHIGRRSAGPVDTDGHVWQRGPLHLIDGGGIPQSDREKRRTRLPVGVEVQRQWLSRAGHYLEALAGCAEVAHGGFHPVNLRVDHE